MLSYCQINAIWFFKREANKSAVRKRFMKSCGRMRVRLPGTLLIFNTLMCLLPAAISQEASHAPLNIISNVIGKCSKWRGAYDVKKYQRQETVCRRRLFNCTYMCANCAIKCDRKKQPVLRGAISLCTADQYMDVLMIVNTEGRDTCILYSQYSVNPRFILRYYLLSQY